MNYQLPADNPLFALAILLSLGAMCGQFAKRIHLPSVSGQILAGVLLGPSVLGVFGHETAHSLTPIVHFALGLIAVDIGTHLHLRRLRNSFRRLGLLLLMEVTATPLFVYLAVVFGARTDWTLGALFGTLAIATAPGTVLSIVKETRSKGVYVRTLVAAVALNNIACIALFEMVYSAVEITLDPAGTVSGSGVLLAPFIQLGGAIVLGGCFGGGLVFVTRHIHKVEQLTTVSIIALFLTSGAADFLGLSNLMSCLFLGVTMANFAPEKEEIGHRVFSNFEPAVMAIFFTMAGLELDFGFLADGWFLVALFVVSRILGKITASFLAMRLARTTENVQRYLGLGLIPQAGVAVGLLLQIRDNPLFDSISPLILAVGVTSVALNEIIGPITARIAMARSGDLGKDRARLIDFIHEENIVTDFQAESKEEALGKLVDLMISSHGMQVDRQELLDNVMAREKAMSTCIGRGLAVPHGALADGEDLVGVMAVSQKGLKFGTPDGMPLRCMVLLAAPPQERGRYLEVQAMLARAIGGKWSLQIQLYNAKSPAHVYEILHAEEFEDFNYFLQEE